MPKTIHAGRCRLAFFGLFPVILGIGLTWLYAYIFTIAGVYDNASAATQVGSALRHLAWPAESKVFNRCDGMAGGAAAPFAHPLPALPLQWRCILLPQKACTTSQSNFNYILSQAPWFRAPYPGQWGSPIFNTSGDGVAGSMQGNMPRLAQPA